MKKLLLTVMAAALLTVGSTTAFAHGTPTPWSCPAGNAHCQNAQTCRNSSECPSSVVGTPWSCPAGNAHCQNAQTCRNSSECPSSGVGTPWSCPAGNTYCQNADTCRNSSECPGNEVRTLERTGRRTGHCGKHR